MRLTPDDAENLLFHLRWRAVRKAAKSELARAALAVLTLCVTACGPGRGGLSSTADETTSDATDSGTETGSSEVECILAIRIDLCCNQPYPATPDELGSDPCIVQWPIDWEALPVAVMNECGAARPDWCEVVDCDFAEPASEVVELDESGTCQWVCPGETYPAYDTAGCGEPPPIVKCLGIPPPCADEYCSCEGETIFGCGQVSEPYTHEGPCP